MKMLAERRKKQHEQAQEAAQIAQQVVEEEEAPPSLSQPDFAQARSKFKFGNDNTPVVEYPKIDFKTAPQVSSNLASSAAANTKGSKNEKGFLDKLSKQYSKKPAPKVHK